VSESKQARRGSTEATHVGPLQEQGDEGAGVVGLGSVGACEGWNLLGLGVRHAGPGLHKFRRRQNIYKKKQEERGMTVGGLDPLLSVYRIPRSDREEPGEDPNGAWGWVWVLVFGGLWLTVLEVSTQTKWKKKEDRQRGRIGEGGGKHNTREPQERDKEIIRLRVGERPWTIADN